MSIPYTLKPDRYSSHAQIARWLLTDRKRRAPNGEYAVLDVGCAAGFLGPWLVPPAFYLMGVDNNRPALANIHPNYRQVIQADIEAPPHFQIDRRPNAMVAADVLEHCRDAVGVLRALCQQYLDADTPVIISLPNIAHLYVRLSLLLGRFNYADRGLLDRTHVHFYTLQTARQLCDQCRIQIDRVAATPLPLPLIDRRFGEGGGLHWLHRLSAGASRAYKKLLAYQFILFGEYRP